MFYCINVEEVNDLKEKYKHDIVDISELEKLSLVGGADSEVTPKSVVAVSAVSLTLTEILSIVSTATAVSQLTINATKAFSCIKQNGKCV